MAFFRATPPSRVRWPFFCAFGLALFVGMTDPVAGDPSAPAKAPPAKPNVLFIIVDDLTTSLGCYGNPSVKSPNIDRLAGRGRIFNRAYCQYPLCNPSRASFLAGIRPEATGVVNNDADPLRHAAADRITIPAFFRAQGYEVVGAGKVGHTKFPMTGVFDREIETFDAAIRDAYPALEARGRAGPGVVRPNVASGLEPYAMELEDEDFPDGRLARAVAALLMEPREKPFLLMVGFHKPHSPWIAPAKYFAGYDRARAMYRPGPPDDLDDIPKIALNEGRNLLAKSEPTARAEIAAYYANVTFVDAQIGIVLDALDAAGLADKTLVVILGDHGYHLGEHQGLWHKITLFEEALRVPLIISVPGMEHPGRKTDSIVELVDLFPTLADLCGLAPPAGLEGASLRPVLSDPSARVKNFAVSVQAYIPGTSGRSIRTERWRYTHWLPAGEEELYDHKTDPGEHENLAHDPDRLSIKKQLRGLLDATTPAHWAATPGRASR